MVFFNRTEKMVSYFLLPQIKYSDVDLHLMKTSEKAKVQSIKNVYSYYNSFVELVNIDLTNINQKIAKYNEIPHTIPTRKITILQEIFALRQALLKKHSGEFISHSLTFRSKIQRGLFNDIKVQADKLNVSLIDLPLLDPKTSLLLPPPSLPLTSVLASTLSQRL